MSLSEASVEDIPHPPESSQSLAVVTSESARQKWKIAALEEKLQILESGHAVKQRETNYYVSKGRAIRRTVTLFDNIEDLICENDRRCDLGNEDENTTDEQDRLQTGYIALNHALPWFHPRASDLEYDDYSYMLKKGADAARGDDTSKLKSLVADWINRELKPDSPIDPEDKHYRGFINDTCGRLLCLTELDWNSPTIRAGIRDRADGYVVTEMSWPAFLYEKYTANQDNLEQGLFKSTLLLQAFKAIFTSPSSAREVTADGDAADVIETNRRAKKDFNSCKKVKTHVAQIIKMHAVTARSIAYVACQLRFALSSVSSWRSVDGDFDYIPFWQNIVDFFERPPGRAAQQRVTRLLAWWTSCILYILNSPQLISVS
ncbi:uncharacterized protein F5891DRAFT_1191492 [Suillus fuscotomentosus]|uniref:Uncharacterized protein n=1 Tax=Suillus fuscotomentosus TaxID=1912939 RepID=A0AAD4HIX8_9AGAM|nr:uncharacterized protein F5891DRAFT_1191492 [Suillus fuscotomentosus]KAG1897866.1 hypothetical protein F5891DRAFT_1191492 [Suillus fuscotomentosus]